MSERTRRGRVAPHDLAAEAAVLASAMVLPEVAAWLPEMCPPDAFYGPGHGLIADAVCKLVVAGEPVDQVTVANWLSVNGLLDEAGGHAGILALAEGAVPAGNAERHAEIVVDLARKRAVLTYAEELATAVYDGRPIDRARHALDEALDRIEGHARVTLTPASAVRMDRTRWVWQGRIPVGGTTLMPGREGFGKTAMVCHLAARLSRGQLEGDWHGRPADVIYVGHEDDRATVTVPRLVAAGADLDRFHFVDLQPGQMFSVAVNVDALARAARGLDVALVVLDPLDSHLGPIDTHRKAEVQSAVGQLARLAQDLRCGALGLGHLNKSDVRDLLAKVVGSVGFTTSVRSVLGVGQHPDNPDEKVVVVGKANMTGDREVPAIRFRVEKEYVPHPDGGEDIDTARVVILGSEDGIDPNSILPRDTSDRSETDEAIDWLHDVLSDGPMAKREIDKHAKREGYSDKVLRTARERLGVVSKRDQNAHGRPSTWELPVTCPLVTCPNPRAHKADTSDQGKRDPNGAYVPSPGWARKQGTSLPIVDEEF